MMSTSTKLYYRVDEVRDILDVSLRTVYRAIERGEIPSMKIRGCIRIPVVLFHQKFGPHPSSPAVSMLSSASTS